MNAVSLLSSVSGPPARLQALRRFAITITVVTLLGHFYIGFETSYACTVVSVLSACSVQLLLEWVRTKSAGLEPGYSQGRFIDFLLPAYIVGMTCAMFLFTNGRYWPLIFATTVAISSKFLLRIHLGDRTTHFMNPSNLGLVAALFFFPAIGMIMPFSFSAGLGNTGDVVFPVILFSLGCFVNGVLTKRLILIFSWFGLFILQAIVRHWFFGAELLPILAVASGPIAIIFSFYMISDPGTTPDEPLPQFVFGATIGTMYGILTVNHVVYGIFWALLVTCALRGAYLVWTERQQQSVGATIDNEIAQRPMAESVA